MFSLLSFNFYLRIQGKYQHTSRNGVFLDVYLEYSQAGVWKEKSIRIDVHSVETQGLW